MLVTRMTIQCARASIRLLHYEMIIICAAIFDEKRGKLARTQGFRNTRNKIIINTEGQLKSSPMPSDWIVSKHTTGVN